MMNSAVMVNLNSGLSVYKRAHLGKRWAVIATSGGESLAVLIGVAL